MWILVQLLCDPIKACVDMSLAIECPLVHVTSSARQNQEAQPAYL